LTVDLALPDWFVELREHQTPAIDEVLDAYRSGVRMVVVDAPTGSGKSLIAEIVRQRLGITANYVCTTKSLQDQVLAAFPYARVMKGRANYPTQLQPRAFYRKFDQVTCDDCTVKNPGGCTLCETVEVCPYQVAKAEAAAAELAVLNTSYFLAECNTWFSKFSGRELVIADECDLLEGELGRYVSVEVSKRRVEQLKLGEPRRVTKEEDWVEWVTAAIPVIQGEITKQRAKVRNLKVEKELRYLTRLYSRLMELSSGLPKGNWIYTGRNGAVSFQPVMVDTVAKRALWEHGGRFLLMSATVISADLLMSELGWEGEYRVVTVPSTFPAANRPVVYRPVANMTNKLKDEEWPKLVPAMERILSEHPSDQTLVHTVSYDLTRYLQAELSNQGIATLTYTNSTEREGVLSNFRAGQARVLLAPSMDRGIDLPGDLCRVQVIAKVPYLNLGDRWVKARMSSPNRREGNRWYKVNAIRSIVQGSGRGVRSEEDTCTTYVLDQQFEMGLWGEWRHLWPLWWREALKWKK
jgi:ATP-dependent DNA helicase DinG